MNIYAKARKDMGLNQKDLAKKMGVTQGAVSALELARNEPSIRYARDFVRLARKHGVPITLDQILGIESDAA